MVREMRLSAPIRLLVLSIFGCVFLLLANIEHTYAQNKKEKPTQKIDSTNKKEVPPPPPPVKPKKKKIPPPPPPAPPKIAEHPNLPSLPKVETPTTPEQPKVEVPTPPKGPNDVMEVDIYVPQSYTDETEVMYQGGEKEWLNYFAKNLKYPTEAKANKIEGIVIVELMIDSNGNIEDVKALKGPEILLEEAIRVVKESKRWHPATKNGSKIKSVKKLPILFELD